MKNRTMEQTKKIMDELEEAAKPLVDFLYKYYDPHTSIVVTESNVDVLCANMGIPLEIRD